MNVERIYGALAIGKTLGDDLRVARVVVRWCIGRKLCYYWCDRSLTAELPQMTRAGPHIPHRFSKTSTTFSPPQFFFSLLPFFCPLLLLLVGFFLLLHSFSCRLSFSFVPQIKKISLNSIVLFKLISPWFGLVISFYIFMFFSSKSFAATLFQLFSSWFGLVIAFYVLVFFSSTKPFAQLIPSILFAD